MFVYAQSPAIGRDAVFMGHIHYQTQKAHQRCCGRNCQVGYIFQKDAGALATLGNTAHRLVTLLAGCPVIVNVNDDSSDLNVRPIEEIIRERLTSELLPVLIAGFCLNDRHVGRT